MHSDEKHHVEQDYQPCGDDGDDHDSMIMMTMVTMMTMRVMMIVGPDQVLRKAGSQFWRDQTH